MSAGQLHLRNKSEVTPTIEGMRPTSVSASAILSKAVIALLLTQLMSSLLSTMASAASTGSPWLVAQSDEPQLANPSSGSTAPLKALSDKALAADRAHDYAGAVQWLFKVVQEEERLLHLLDQNKSDSFSRILRQADLDAARYNIGHHYELGLGVPQDYGKAAYWYQQAKSFPEAAARLKQLDAGKSPRNADDTSDTAQSAPTQRQEQLRPRPPQPAAHERDWSVGNWACNAWVGTSPWNIMSGCNQ
jgi:TPR repeat protein